MKKTLALLLALIMAFSLTAQTAFAALVVIGPLVAPTVFPSFHGWELAVFLVALALPIGRSIADCQMRGF